MTSQESSDRERLSAHAEVLALQEKLGISYKDAAHRLYMAEMERLKTDQKTYKVFTTVKSTTKKTMQNAVIALKSLERDCEEVNTAEQGNYVRRPSCQRTLFSAK